MCARPASHWLFALAAALFGTFTPFASTWLIDNTGDKASPGVLADVRRCARHHRHPHAIYRGGQTIETREAGRCSRRRKMPERLDLPPVARNRRCFDFHANNDNKSAWSTSLKNSMCLSSAAATPPCAPRSAPGAPAPPCWCWKARRNSIAAATPATPATCVARTMPRPTFSPAPTPRKSSGTICCA